MSLMDARLLLRSHLALGLVGVLAGLGIFVAYQQSQTMEAVLSLAALLLVVPSAGFAVLAWSGLRAVPTRPDRAHRLLGALGMVATLIGASGTIQAIRLNAFGTMSWTLLAVSSVVLLGVGLASMRWWISRRRSG